MTLPGDMVTSEAESVDIFLGVEGGEQVDPNNRCFVRETAGEDATEAVSVSSTDEEESKGKMLLLI